MDVSAVEPQAVTEQLGRILASAVFARADRSSALLRYIVEQTLEGHGDRLKEYTLGAVALNRGESFDPRTDPVVRAEASRLRTRLDQYYRTADSRDAILIALPKGSYVANFSARETAAAPVTDKAAPEPTLRRVNLSTWIAATLAVVSLLLVFALWQQRGRAPERAVSVAQFDVELRSSGKLSSEVGNDIAISPDGARIVFVSRSGDGRSQLYTRRLDQPNATALPGTEGARVPFFSPDGRWVGFGADSKLKKTAAAGGAPVILCEANDLFGATWGDDDTIVAAIGRNKLWRVPVAGGAPRIVTDLAADSTARWPQLLPGGEFVLYTASDGTGADRARIEVQSLRDATRKVLVTGGTFGRYLAGGYLTYVNQGTLYAVPFDPRTLDVDGAATPIIDDVAYSPLFGYAQAEIAASGVLVYRKGEGRLAVIDWVDRAGRQTPLLAKPGHYGWPRLSPDARFLAVTTTESGARTLLVHDTNANTTRRLATLTGEYSGLLWYHRSMLFGGSNGMVAIDLDHPETSVQLTHVPAVNVPWSISPDENRLAFYDRSPSSGFDLWTARIERDRSGIVKVGPPEPFLRSSANETGPSFSPDGRFLAYTSNESGTQEIYVRRFPDDGTRVQVSTQGGSHVRWSGNGRELLYRTVARRVAVVKYRIAGESFSVEAPQLWPSPALADTGVLPSFDVARDGERILAIVPSPGAAEPSSDNHATFVLNFHEEVRRRLATRP